MPPQGLLPYKCDVLVCVAPLVKEGIAYVNLLSLTIILPSIHDCSPVFFSMSSVVRSKLEMDLTFFSSLGLYKYFTPLSFGLCI